MFTCSETLEVQDKEPAGTGMHRTLLCSPVCPWCTQELQNALRGGEHQAPSGMGTLLREEEMLFLQCTPTGVCENLFPVWLLGGFFSCS